MQILIPALPWLGVFGLLVAAFLYRRILRYPPGNERLVVLSSQISRGAMLFLTREYRLVLVLVVLLAVAGGVTLGAGVGLALLSGAGCSMFAGWFGMCAATRAGGRTTQAAIDGGEARAFQVAFLGGSVMGLAVSSIAFAGLAVLLWGFGEGGAPAPLRMMNAFALGASCVALFARVGGGIYTKGADVGADLAGKVEASIPEDDPRNPGVIADNVGDCVGDTAGMGADLLESYVGALVAATVIAAGLADSRLVVFPFFVAAMGILSSLLGLVLVFRCSGRSPHLAIRGGFALTGVLYLVGSAGVEWALLGQCRLVWAVAIGIVCGSLLGWVGDYFTSGKPIRQIADAAQQGAGPNVIMGLAIGMRSVLLPVLTLGVTIVAAHGVADLYGIALAALGMLGTIGMVMTADAFGPIADNAGGLAEMSQAGETVRETTDRLDTIGNTTAAIGKGFAIGSATLTAVALFSAFHATVSKHTALDLSLTNVEVVMGLLLGVAVPFVFAGSTIQAVGRAAQRMVDEIRRQFREIDGLLEGTAEPDTDRCVAIATEGALKEMRLPGLGALLAPVAVGFALGPAALGGFLAGAVASGASLGIFMAHGGGAWDNAKKWIEAGNLGGKGSAAHEAAVVGDTIGDPFKDTAGPSMNILIKLMTVVSLFIAPLL
jgi:K(+)-stimulated pyrophosphate-energized sodium pump